MIDFALQLKLFKQQAQMKSSWNAVNSTFPQTQPVHEHLNKKYDIHFNFFLTKVTNQIIYNHVVSPNFIHFKDNVIFADNNQYLKRYYFLKNSIDKPEIFDRINLLAQFYGNAVLLKHEYPLMVITRTKQIFLKRIKRLKKYLVEEGSSDESNQNKESEAVSINSSRFLRTISSQQLERKSIDSDNHLQLDFSLFKEEEFESHDIYSPQIDEEQAQTNIFLANITKFTRQMSCELNLEKNQKQSEVSHLLLDFDDFEKQDVLRKYNKIIEKENKMINSGRLKRTDSMKGSKYLHMQNQKVKDLMDKKPMTSSITITALEDQQQQSQRPAFPAFPSSPPPPEQKEYFKKKSMMSPRYSEHPQNNPNRPPAHVKMSSIYQYEREYNNFPLSNEYVISQDDMDDSPAKRFYKQNQNQPREEDPYYTNRERMNYRGPYEPKTTKYSSILNKQSYRKPFQNDLSPSDRVKALSYRQRQMKEQYNYDHYPAANAQNRMTHINININNLEQKKQQHRVNVKVQKKNKFQDRDEQDRNYRAEKKRKIRQKAAALLTRVKSQEYMKPLLEFDAYDLGSGQYYDKYYN